MFYHTFIYLQAKLKNVGHQYTLHEFVAPRGIENKCPSKNKTKSPVSDIHEVAIYTYLQISRYLQTVSSLRRSIIIIN